MLQHRGKAGEAWQRAHGGEVVELACIAVRDGVPASEAVEWVRVNYVQSAVETDAQRVFVARFGA